MMQPRHRDHRANPRGALAPRGFGALVLVLGLSLSVVAGRAEVPDLPRGFFEIALGAYADADSARAAFAEYGWTETARGDRLVDAIAIALPLESDLPADKVDGAASALYLEALDMAALMVADAAVFVSPEGAEAALVFEPFGPAISVRGYFAAPVGADVAALVASLPGDHDSAASDTLVQHFSRPDGGDGVMVNATTVIVPNQPNYDAVNPGRPDIPAILTTSVLLRS